MVIIHRRIRQGKVGQGSALGRGQEAVSSIALSPNFKHTHETQLKGASGIILWREAQCVCYNLLSIKKPAVGGKSLPIYSKLHRQVGVQKSAVVIKTQINFSK